jgi:hypothetical protein
VYDSRHPIHPCSPSVVKERAAHIRQQAGERGYTQKIGNGMEGVRAT